MKINNIKESNLHEIQRLCTLSFGEYYDASISDRRLEYLQYALELNPQGCFLAIEGSQIIGFIFSRIWGKTGFLGIFGVHPDKKGSGVGSILLKYGARSLVESACTTIGLETMPTVGRNLGFYLKNDFFIISPTIAFKKIITNENIENNKHQLLNEVSNLSDFKSIALEINPCINYFIEAELAYKYQWGKTFIIKTNKYPIGYIILREKHFFENMNDRDMLMVHSMVLDNSDPEIFNSVLKELEEYAMYKGQKSIFIPANSYHTSAISGLIKHNYRVMKSTIRFVLNGYDYLPQHIDLSRWAM